nr:DUF2752 domain-containing protein [uncultured Capnocytophaga sp.]
MKPKTFYLFISLFCCASWGWLLGFEHFRQHSSPVGVTLCPIKAVTGYPCPSCGTTRSVHTFFEGHISEALWVNPLGIVAGLLLAVVPLWLLHDALRRRATLHKFFIAFEQWFKRPYVYIPFFTFIVLNWIWNLYKNL